jgi:hypothetical protein
MKLTLGPSTLSTELDFTIPTLTQTGKEVTRVGIFSSGGHDSGALLCLIMAELKATGKLDTIPVTAFTIVKDEGSTYYSQRVVSKISEHFGVPISHVNNIPNSEPAYSKGRIGNLPIIKTWGQNQHNMILFMSINRMAPDDIRPFKQKLEIYYPDEKNFYKAPFLLLHKPQILDIYYKLGCEDIIQYTHSCTVQAVGTCNNCYSCKEREWGFTALDKEFIDTVPPDIEDISCHGTWQFNNDR